MGKELPQLTGSKVCWGILESLNTMSNTPLVDIIPPNGGLVNGNTATLIQDGNIQPVATNSNNKQQQCTQNNGNVPNFHAMSKQELETIAALQFEKLQRFYSIIAMPNKVYSPAEKLVLLVAPDVLAKETPNPQGLKRIDMGQVAKHIGLAGETVATKVKNICERSNATRAVEPYTTRNGQRVNLVYVNDGEPTWAAPTTIEPAPEKLRNLPGDERRVCACGGAMHKKKRILRTQETWTCEECGEQIALQPVQELEPLEVTYSEGPQHADLTLESPTIEQEPENLEECEGLQVVGLSEQAEEPEILTALNAYTVLSDVVSPVPARRVQFENIPDALKARKQWVVWRYGTLNPKTGKREKIPYNARPGANNARASVNNLMTWVPGEQAIATYEASQNWMTPYDGIGYVFMEDDPYTGLDWDNCLTPGTQEWTDEQALADVLAVNSYTEVSPSGSGVKTLVETAMVCYVASNPRGPEMYSDRHYFTLTGNRLDIVSHAIEERSEPVQAIFDRVAPQITTLDSKPCVSVPCRFSDEQVLEKAMHGAYGAMFLKLWNGDASEFPHKDGKQDGEPDYSRADYALCRELAHWTQNAEQIARLFTQSKLYRAEKWNRKARSGETYGAGTIREVLSKKQVAS